jgi:hypothetical protein
MALINSIRLHTLRNNEHFQFMTDVKNTISAATPLALNLEGVFPDFTAAWDNFNAAMLVDSASLKTTNIKDLDKLNDRTWSAIGGRIRATLNGPIAAEVESAIVLKHIYDLYGNVRQMSYIEEVAALFNLVEDFEKPENAAHCNTIGMTNWVAALKQQVADFQGMLDERNVEQAHKESGVVKAAREAIEPLYEQIVSETNARVTLNMATPEIENFVLELNQRIKYYNDLLAAREGRNSAD